MHISSPDGCDPDFKNIHMHQYTESCERLIVNRLSSEVPNFTFISFISDVKKSSTSSGLSNMQSRKLL
uniref:Uncharacterized protein n=1 Tax=Romanomermis culicivorax TaxID=13658 RepID=A0A915JXY7_ROMCU